MRSRLIDELGTVPYRRFLVYLMGSYRAFDLEGALESLDSDTIPEALDFEKNVGVARESDGERSEVGLDFMLGVRDTLRNNAGVNAFLAIDADVSLEEMDAATQSIAFARASNAVVYVVPAMGDNLGVGIEAGAVLESLYAEGEATHRRERVLFVHESGVRSAMIAAVCERWEARVYAYHDLADLDRQLRLFVRDLMRKERTGQLPRL